VRIAFKEWAVVVDALGRGDQIIILRKGGLREGRGGFQIEQPAFLLFPTAHHQQREAVLPEAQARFDEIEKRGLPADAVRLEFIAEVVAWRKLASRDAIDRLTGQHIWRNEVIARRFEWGEEQGVLALAVRVSRLPQAAELPIRPEYGGCRSWVTLATDVDVTAARPVLSEALFTAKLKQFHSALESVAIP
jgi:hypothetical protein